jgi:hypothetical protein
VTTVPLAAYPCCPDLLPEYAPTLALDDYGGDLTHLDLAR